MREELGNIISNVLTDMPIWFEIGTERMCLYPLTLGKLYLTSQLVNSLDIDKKKLSINPYLEILRIVKSKRKDCCKLIAYYAKKRRNEILDTNIINNFSCKLEKIADDEDLTTLMIIILKDNTLEEIIKGVGLDKEAERMAKVNAAKDNKSLYIFGGKTIWGSLIDAACERYGWTYDYVVWGISYRNLTLMLKDKLTTIYLSEDETKKCRVPKQGGDYIDGNDKDAVMKAVVESELHPE